MLIRDSCHALQDALQGPGQPLNRLDPRAAWKAFKTFLHTRVEDAQDAAALQFTPRDPEDDEADEAALLLVRHFSERDAATGEDAPRRTNRSSPSSTMMRGRSWWLRQCWVEWDPEASGLAPG